MVLPIMLTSSGFDDLRRSEGVASCSSRSKRAVPVTLWLLLVTDENAGQRSMVTVTRVSVVLSIRVYIDGWKRTVVRLAPWALGHGVSVGGFKRPYGYPVDNFLSSQVRGYFLRVTGDFRSTVTGSQILTLKK